jgi:mannitol/fructose-specific phosphotransferase system IIA component (Ntr-type)
MDDHDLVISTVPITNWDKPAIVVNPLLDRNDIIRIRSFINTFDTGAAVDRNTVPDEMQYSLNHLLTKQTIELQVAAQGWEDVVDWAGLLLLRISAIEHRYIEAMKSILLEHGPFMVIMPGIALLHAYPESGVRRPSMSLVTLQKPVLFGHEEFDPVSLAFALGAVDNTSHLRALSELAEMLQDQSAVDVMKNTAQKARILNIVSKYSRKKQ